ncbi:MAG: ABC transporter ATP-binding protein [Acidibacillus sp.]|uniref:Vitamin B12 import ATP-binding protein BtuD n=1 Tax=Sulfoacidibacillus ferrooxidans TaxID=2005001 RepID=A0A9X1V9U0_9BACL|nr:ABC transporter ATP-binding protein [Sulfoacidibacillus ferrooxidans]MCI0183914.1 Vitamin B12 import ATP-binding protein BtuD [Sulfoacidibacillus ferrooxidans]MCY0893585.1 ABC transporter ATP-binding protein [Acidibacillus sp.]
MLQIDIELQRSSFTIEVHLRLPLGGIYGLFGPSAAGKSSILNAMAGFETEAKGIITLEDQIYMDTFSKTPNHLPPWERQIGYVEQTANLFPHLTVFQNIFFSVQSKPTKWHEELIDRLSLRPYLLARPAVLSGGLAQRVALARALARRPKLLLLDEPLSALDFEARSELQDVILTIQHEVKCTTLLVTHQLDEAQKMCDQIGIMDRGHVLQIGTPAELMDHPSSPRVAQLLGYDQFLHIKNGNSPSNHIAVHPDHVVLGSFPSQGICLDGHVLSLSLHGGKRRIVVSLIQHTASITATLAPTQSVNVGQAVVITVIHPPQFVLDRVQ